ncbi:MAG: outer membrane protein assembly factor BamE [Alphaproteobacteria bacterium]|nr:outer membrane protein assembly factor BamE [Alphaproteobacteria bacterium]
MKKRSPLFFFALFALGACAPTVANRGHSIDADLLAQLKPGLSTREDVAVTLGSPTVVSSFDDKVWYYIGCQTEKYTFSRAKILQEEAVEVDFDDKGVVTAVKNLDIAGASPVQMVERETPTFGQEKTVLRELLGDFSRARPAMQKKRTGGI